MKNLALLFLLIFSSNFLVAQDTGKNQQPLINGDNDVDTPEANATVRINNGSCTGTLIDPTTVMTAGHCFQWFKHPLCEESCIDAGRRLCEEVVDHLDDPDACNWAKPGHWYPLDRPIKIEFGNERESMHMTVEAHHINFVGWADVVLLKLENAIPRSVAIPVPPLTRLPRAAMDDPEDFWDDQNFVIAGWGRGSENTRKVGTASGANYNDRAPWGSCRGAGDCECTPTKICIRNADAIIAPGDSGGPLYWTDESGKKYVIGVTQQLNKYIVTFTRGGEIFDGRPTPNIGGWLDACLDKKSNLKGYDQRGLGINESNDLFGSSFAVGNFYSDDFQFPDLAVGAPGEDISGSGANAGAVFLFSGSDIGFTKKESLTQEPVGRNEAGDKFGTAIATGDVNNDGKVDIFVGAPGEDYRGSGRNAGMVYFFRGDGNGVETPILVTQTPTDNHERGDLFGSALVMGDFNGDGFDDLAVGSPGEGTTGAVYIYEGNASGIATTPTSLTFGRSVGNRSGEKFGTALVVGDFNYDGNADLVVGAPFKQFGTARNIGTVYMFKGSHRGLRFHREYNQSHLRGVENETGDNFGSALAVGDFNNNRYPDLAIGVPGENYSGGGANAGSVFVVSDIYSTTSSLLTTQVITQAPFGRNESGDLFGSSLAVGDLNGDTIDDLAIGTPGENFSGSGPKAGLVYLCYGLPAESGRTGGLSQPFAINQKPAGRNEGGDRFGAALIMAKKYPNVYELIIGAPGENVSGSGSNAGVFFHRPWNIIMNN